jgi:hypothetical protein
MIKFAMDVLKRVRKIAESDYKLHVCLSVCPSVWNNSAHTERIFKQYFRKSVQKIQVSFKPGINNGYFTYRAMYIFGHISLNSSLSENFFRH